MGVGAGEGDGLGEGEGLARGFLALGLVAFTALAGGCNAGGTVDAGGGGAGSAADGLPPLGAPLPAGGGGGGGKANCAQATLTNIKMDIGRNLKPSSSLES
jgi:hypothetical protein